MSTPAPGRRHRLSIYAPGELDKTASPVKHHACKTRERAEKLYANYTRKLPGQRVILHLGKLRGLRCVIVRDTHPEGSYYDQLTRRFTAFRSFVELIEAPGYFPSLNIAVVEKRTLADAYDAEQARRGSTLRAHRYDAPPRWLAILRESQAKAAEAVA